MTFFLLVLGLAHAGPPDTLGLVAEPAEVVAAYSKAATQRGRSGAAAKLDCRPAFDGLLFCLTLVTPQGWRYATQGDVQTWGMTSEQAHRQAAQRLRTLGVAQRLSAQTVDGVPGSYHAARLDDGQDAAPLLVPERLAAHIGGPPVVAVPAQGALIAWVPDNPALDTVVAVGVRRMYEDSDHAISPRIYRWGKDGWMVWGEAKKPQAKP